VVPNNTNNDIAAAVYVVATSKPIIKKSSIGGNGKVCAYIAKMGVVFEMINHKKA
jgi:hypothetical protein